MKIVTRVTGMPMEPMSVHRGVGVAGFFGICRRASNSQGLDIVPVIITRPVDYTNVSTGFIAYIGNLNVIDSLAETARSRPDKVARIGVHGRPAIVIDAVVGMVATLATRRLRECNLAVCSRTLMRTED